MNHIQKILEEYPYIEGDINEVQKLLSELSIYYYPDKDNAYLIVEKHLKQMFWESLTGQHEDNFPDDISTLEALGFFRTIDSEAKFLIKAILAAEVDLVNAAHHNDK